MEGTAFRKSPPNSKGIGRAWQASFDEGLEGVDEELDVLRVAVGLGKGAGEPPEAAEAAALKKKKR